MAIERSITLSERTKEIKGTKVNTEKKNTRSLRSRDCIPSSAKRSFSINGHHNRLLTCGMNAILRIHISSACAYTYADRHEAIYAYIYVLPRGTLKKELIANLRQARSYRRHQKRSVIASRNLENRLSIHERPKEVESRTIPGHWEGDLIIGKRNPVCVQTRTGRQSALGTLVERTTRSLILIPLKSREGQTRIRTVSLGSIFQKAQTSTLFHAIGSRKLRDFSILDHGRYSTFRHRKKFMVNY